MVTEGFPFFAVNSGDGLILNLRAMTSTENFILKSLVICHHILVNNMNLYDLSVVDALYPSWLVWSHFHGSTPFNVAHLLMNLQRC